MANNPVGFFAEDLLVKQWFSSAEPIEAWFDKSLLVVFSSSTQVQVDGNSTCVGVASGVTVAYVLSAGVSAGVAAISGAAAWQLLTTAGSAGLGAASGLTALQNLVVGSSIGAGVATGYSSQAILADGNASGFCSVVGVISPYTEGGTAVSPRYIWTPQGLLLKLVDGVYTRI